MGGHEALTGAAVFDPTGCYRYRLDRAWDAGPTVVFVGLNPHRADADTDDPAIRRCLGFARRWGYGRLVVVNLFAWRARSPRDLRRVADPVGPEADAFLHAAIAEADRVVACWGNAGTLGGRDAAVRPLLGPCHCLGLTLHGHPKHPLYLSADTPLEPFE